MQNQYLHILSLNSLGFYIKWALKLDWEGHQPEPEPETPSVTKAAGPKLDRTGHVQSYMRVGSTLPPLMRRRKPQKWVFLPGGELTKLGHGYSPAPLIPPETRWICMGIPQGVALLFFPTSSAAPFMLCFCLRLDANRPTWTTETSPLHCLEQLY